MHQRMGRGQHATLAVIVCKNVRVSAVLSAPMSFTCSGGRVVSNNIPCLLCQLRPARGGTPHG